MAGMIPVVVLIIILAIAGYVVYRSLVEERRGATPGSATDDGAVRPAIDPPDAQPPPPPRARPNPPETSAGPELPQPPADDAGYGRSGGDDEDVSAADTSGLAAPPPRPRGRPRRRRTGSHDPALADHVGKLCQAVDAELISTDEAVASLVRSSGGALDENGARAMLAQAASRSAEGPTDRGSTSRGSTSS